jgi:hypothetical protein
MTRIYIAVPCYGGQMHATCTLSILELDRLCRERGIEVEYQMVLNESLIPRARNYLVHQFLQSTATHLLFIDSDIQFSPEDVIKMLEADKDVIGGLYCKKEMLWEKIAECVKAGKPVEALQYNTSGVVFWPLEGFAELTDIKLAEPLEVRYLGTGLLMVKRGVFEKMQETDKERTYDYKGEQHHAFFDCRIENNNYLSEDYFFCQRWRELGGHVYAALWVRTVHFGNLGLHTNLSMV